MNTLTNVGVLLAFFFLMEGVAWFTHKFIMHGFLWVWHKSHHEPRKGVLELNDLFGFMFAIPSVVLIVLGAAEFDWRFFAGLGIAFYGFAYFLVHDVFVHQRVKWLTKTQVPYFKAMRQTHHLHHAVHTKEGAQAFGFLFVLPRFYRKYNGKK
ncbi:MAG: beta-carotene hydroxylase [Bacteroidia bacterium]